MEESNKETIIKANMQLGQEVKRQTRTYVIVLTCLSTLGGFLFGYDTGVVSGAMLLINREFNLSPAWHELVVSSTIGAAFIFSLVGGWFSDRHGRKKSILLSGVIFTLGSIVMGAANTKEVLLTGRIVVGIAIGFESMSVPVYVAECAESSQRGMLVTCYQLFITLGMIAATVVDGLFANVQDGWRYMLGLAAIPAFLQFCGFCFMPESPRWLAAQNRYKEARAALQKIRGTESGVEEELNAVKNAIEDKERELKEHTALYGGSSLFMQVVKSPTVRRALVVGFALQLFQQLSGINTVMYYSASIIKMSGIRDEAVAIWTSAGVAAVNFFATFLGIFVVERLGRRKLVLWSYMGVILSLVLLGIGFHMMKVSSPSVTNTYGHDPCAAAKSCAGCISIPEGCGFCSFSFENGSVESSACWPLNQDTRKPLHGECGAGSIGANNLNAEWADGWCSTIYFWVPIFGMTVYLISFAPGMGPMPWTINAELYPLWARGFCTSITTSASWLGNVIISSTFLTLVNALSNEGAFLLYAAIAVVGFCFLFAFLPETRGCNLEEVEALFQGPWLVFRQNNRTGCSVGSRNVQYVHIRGLNRASPRPTTRLGALGHGALINVSDESDD